MKLRTNLVFMHSLDTFINEKMAPNINSHKFLENIQNMQIKDFPALTQQDITFRMKVVNAIWTYAIQDKTNSEFLSNKELLAEWGLLNEKGDQIRQMWFEFAIKGKGTFMIKQDGTVLQQTTTGWQSDTTLQINTIAELLSQADQITLVDPPNDKILKTLDEYIFASVYARNQQFKKTLTPLRLYLAAASSFGKIQLKSDSKIWEISLIENQKILDFEIDGKSFIIDETQIKRKYKHAADFGCPWNYNPLHAEIFVQKIIQHLIDGDTLIQEGLYSTSPIYEGYHFYNPQTKLWVFFAEESGILRFHVGLILGNEQYGHLMHPPFHVR